MRTTTAIFLGMVLLSVTIAYGYMGNAQSQDEYSSKDQAQLEIKGSSGAEFSGFCAVGDGESEEISGQVPQSFVYDPNGEPLKCEIASEGDIEVILTAYNTRSVQQISGGTLNLTYQNGSIYSSTSSSGSSSSGSSSSGSSSSISSSVSSSSISSSGENDEESSDATDGSANVVSEPRDVSDFDEVELRGVGNLSIQQADSESLTVEAEEDVLPKIRTEVVNNRLIIGPEPNTSIQTSQPINYTLTVKDLNALKVSESGDIQAEGISTDKLGVIISGAGDVEISGRADGQEIDISGTGDYQAKDLESKEAKVDVGGTGSAIVNASDELDAKVSGAGSVEYVGDPTVNQDVSGTGEVSKH